MRSGKDYLQEVQKFTTSQYWNSGVRITTGVMLPMLIMANQGWLGIGMPFLWGALFVSLTDTPGPIHHRRNGMLAGIAFNACTVIITGVLRNHEAFLLGEVILFTFFFSLFGIYGARAGAVGSLALVIMLLNMSPLRQQYNFYTDSLLTAGGGLWYTTFSILLFRLQPYRLVEQALGENLLEIADYIRSRASFYKEETDISESYTRVMKEQVDVLKIQNQTRELLFKTRQFVGDASPKSRSMMMVFLESVELFEETMYSYQDYRLLHQHTRHMDLMPKFYGLILQIAAELEIIGLSVQAGTPVKSTPDFSVALDGISKTLAEHKRNSGGTAVHQSLYALEQTLENIREIINRMCKLVVYTRMQIDVNPTLPVYAIEQVATTQPLQVSLIVENLTLRSNNFRYAIRLTLAMIIGYGIAAAFSLSHVYWVLLTIITILKPVYNVTRRRNIQRVIGTLIGVLVASAILFLLSNGTVLLVIMIISMLMAYSFLRINYLGFVTFLTTYIIITFHFLNPVEFKNLIGERLIDTFVGSVIAALAARFIFPVWEHKSILQAMKNMLLANQSYLLAACDTLKDSVLDKKQYNVTRNEAIVALTNLSDNFQHMLAEPGQARQSTHIHQFVIANHALTSRISALTKNDLVASGIGGQQWIKHIVQTLKDGETSLETGDLPVQSQHTMPDPLPSLNPISIIYSLAFDIRSIVKKVMTTGTEKPSESTTA